MLAKHIVEKMNLVELEQALEHAKHMLDQQHKIEYGCIEYFEQEIQQIENEIAKHKPQTLHVTHELGYGWSVYFEGQESFDEGLTKAEAMNLAKQIKKQYAKGLVTIKAQKLTKEEKIENIKYLHEMGVYNWK